MKNNKINRIAVVGLIIGLVLCLGMPEARCDYVRSKQLNTLRPRPQSTPNATVYVEPGVVSVANNVKIDFAEGNSPSFSAVTEQTPDQSRIDLLVLNSSGTLEIVQGTQAVTPTAPTYPSDKLVLAEVTITEESPATPSITYADIRDVRFFLNLGGGVSTATDSAYVNVTGDTMTGTLNLPANGLVAGTNQLVLSGGNVGIGTTSPASKLDLEGGGTANGITLGTANQAQIYYDATNSRLVIKVQ